MQSIRIAGDIILQKPGLRFPEQPTAQELQQLVEQIQIAKKVLIATGGAGIAANQCADIHRPYQFAIVGVFYENKEHTENVGKRYPGVKFPQANIMINPKIVHSGVDAMTFHHGCLSVPGRMRGEIKTPREITVVYKTLDSIQKIQEKATTARDVDAVVLQHELNHILFGKTYFDCCVSELSEKDLAILKECLLKEKSQRAMQKNQPNSLISKNEFYRFINIDKNGNTLLDKPALIEALSECTTDETLSGLIKQSNLKKSLVPTESKTESYAIRSKF